MRDLILYSKRKDATWREKQRKNGEKGGRPKTQNNPDKPKETQNNPDDVWVNSESHNVNGNENSNENGNDPKTAEEPPLLINTIQEETEKVGFTLDIAYFG